MTATMNPLVPIQRMLGRIGATLALVALPLAGSAGVAVAELPETVYIASGQAGSLQHTVASAVAKVASDNLGIKVVVRPYSGTTAFFPVLNDGEVEFGLAPSVDFALSYQGPERLKIGGRNPYPQTPELRLVASGSKLIAGMLVRKDSEIGTVADLEGKTIAGEYPAHLGAYINTFAHLLNAGHTWDDVDIVPAAGLNQGMDALVNGRVDGAVYGVGAPKVREADASVGVRFAPDLCTDEAKQRVQDSIPGYGFITLPAGRLPGIVEDTCVTAYSLYLVASTSTAEEVVEAVASALYEDASELAQYHPTLRGWKAETAVTPQATLPYHDAAVAAYKAKDAWSADMDARNMELLGK